MKNAIIDIGSNSVRLLFNGQKYVENTQLAENLMNTGKLCENAMERTINAVKSFAAMVKNNGASGVYAFATEAVRAATNRNEFIDKINELGINFQLLSTEEESKAGFMGAYTDKCSAILDIGGASSELTVGDEKGIIYAHSLPLGSVRLKDYSDDALKQYEYACFRVKEYGKVPKFDKLISIGGSVSVLKAVSLKMKDYDPNVIHNSVMSRGEIKTAVESILAVNEDERKFIPGLPEKKIKVAPAGGIIAVAIMNYLGADKLILSERDNLEGFAMINNIEI